MARIRSFGLLGGILAALLVIGLALSSFSGMLGYILTPVASDEVGIKFIQNQPIEVLPPGVYTDYGVGNLWQYKSVQTIRISALQFQVDDSEVLTKDKQRIGLTVTGTVQRPGVAEQQILLSNWANYRQFYTDDILLVGRVITSEKSERIQAGLMQSLATQASKVCVGDSNFDDAVIGSARDNLRECIERELTGLAGGYGLKVANIVVPNVILSKEVQTQLDAITKARLDTQLAQQRQLQAKAEADQEAAKQQGIILVEQGRIQERARQDALTAELQRKALEAQRSQIEASKNNELYQAQRDKDIAEAQRQAAALKAQADLAPELARASMYQSNPAYAHLQEVQAVAGAYKNTDKVIMLPNDTNPIMVLGDPSNRVVVQPTTGPSGQPTATPTTRPSTP